MRRLLCSLLLLLTLAPAAHAQVTVTYTFINGTTADADQVNANFAKLGDALNRTGGTMTGTLTSRTIVPDANNTRDLGASGTKYNNLYISTITATGASNARLLQTFTNTTSGTTASAGWQATAGTTNVFLEAFSQGFTSSGSAVQSGVRLMADGAGGISLVSSNAAGTIDVYTNNTLRWRYNLNGNLLPTAASTLNLGGPANQIATTYSDVVAASNGTNAAPSISFYNETDTGMYRVTTDVIGWATAGALRWGVNAVGDFIFGTSSDVALSSGIPNTLGGAGGNGGEANYGLNGFDYATWIRLGGTGGAADPAATITYNFGHTLSNTPVCLASGNGTSGVTAVATTTGVSLTRDDAALFAVASIVRVHCHSY